MLGAALLATKTRMPPLPRGHVARPRLAMKLLDALRDRMVLVSAPAGFGKTTLVVEALRQTRQPGRLGRCETRGERKHGDAGRNEHCGCNRPGVPAFLLQPVGCRHRAPGRFPRTRRKGRPVQRESAGLCHRQLRISRALDHAGVNPGGQKLLRQDGAAHRFSVAISSGPVTAMTMKAPLLNPRLKRAFAGIVADILHDGAGPREDVFIKPLIPKPIILKIKEHEWV